MSNDDALLAGELSSWPTKERLADILRAAGLRINVGRYSIRVENCEAFSFEQYGGDIGDPQIAAAAGTVQKMVHDAQLVSSALSAAGIRHRFEIYDRGDDLAAYLHHDWPIKAAL